MSTSYPPHYAYPSAPPLQRALPSPPRLHWGWVLALSVITFGMFGNVWLVVQANWIRRMREGKSTGFWLAIANLALVPAVFFYGFAVALAVRLAPTGPAAALLASLDPVARIASFLLYVCTAFAMRSEMEREPIGLSLGGVMTFLFAPLYFQFHLQDYSQGFVPEIGLGLNSPAPAGVAYPTQAVAYPLASEVALPPFDPSE